ncbi:hypothetical protein MKX03_003459 [Papaver bracteatum]|nr:hypothetical protein MKX03_003459 [Papaver bracteatum]
MSWWEGNEESRLLIAPKSGSSTGTGNVDGVMLSLKHPKSGNKACYFLNNGSLQELNWFKQSYGSWFLGDYVCQDGGLYITTAIDPVFLFLPIFDEARLKKNGDQGMFRSVDEVYQLKTTLPTLDKNYGAQSEKDTLIEALLCNHLKLDLRQAPEPSSHEFVPHFVETAPADQAKNNSNKKPSNSGKQAKKMKAETNSQNIKDMFRRVTRSGK